MINKAIMFATISHSNQCRKGTNIPYILHPLEAGIIVSQIKYDENLVCAAILHDITEDVHVSYKTLEVMFGKRIADLVKSQSEDKTKSWTYRKTHTIESMRDEKDEDIKIICLGDKLSNIRSLYNNYELEKENLWQRFNVKDKNMHGWYYKGLAESLSSLHDFKEYQEYKELVYSVFYE
ncbi:HD domain-containing protein [Clostridium estertheticum]|uniref:HD domain-containing protein n=1 Tax=Clostridium estertheticum TaxID=238834 RepID=UPI0013E937B0|nr:HD domain-containing protein [Clostridium estertheticum]MBZ9688617.1 HD domain-containing protein [Clostridium estertheticum]